MTQGKSGETAETWSRLAEILQFTVQAISRWRRLPGAPEGPQNVAAWREFIAANDLGIVGNRSSKDREALLIEKLTKENKLLDLKIAKEERTSVARSEVDELLLHVATLQKAVLFPALENELPPRAEGRSAAEISVMGRELGDRICGIFAQAMETWNEGTH